jgi:nucleoid DNA-binding protein
MDKLELIEYAKEKAGYNDAQARIAIDTVFRGIKEALNKGDDVVIQKFGAFRIRTAKARTARNPRTGEKINVPERKKVVFKPAKDLLE